MAEHEDDSGDLEARNEELRLALQEATQTLDAIRNGEVDAVVVGGPNGQVVYTLENADRPYRVLVEQMREGALTLSGEGVILYCNRSFADFVGVLPVEILGQSLSRFIEDRASLEALLAGAGDGLSQELAIVTADGRRAPCNISVIEMTVEEGEGRMLCAIVTDLTHNYERAHDLAEANARLAAEITERARAEQSLAIALEAADMGSWDYYVGRTGQAVRSHRHDAIYGYDTPVEKWGLRETVDRYLPEDRADVEAAFRGALTSGRVEYEKRIRRANDGALRWIYVKGRTFYRDGKPERLAGIVADNTARRQIDEQLRQGQKMEAIGQLTGGIAHDFNNLLMIIGGSLEALSRRVTLDDRVQRLLDAARLGVSRGAKLNEQLLAFARRQDMHRESIRLTELLPTFETLLDRAVGEAVEVEIRQAPDLWACKADFHQLETAILNVAINARDAMENRGRLILSTANATISTEESHSVDAPSGDYVRITVTDTGGGMSPETAERVFEPFFTTKEVGKGTGLGLSQVYGFVRQSGGFVTLDSEIGRGTMVSLYLPRAEALPAEPAAAPSEPSIRRSGGAVLLVEDDADVRATARAMLEEIGFTILEAPSGKAALDMLRVNMTIDLVFSDVIMSGGMTGVELAEAVELEWPDLPVLLTSGYTAQRLAPSATKTERPLLRKPYTLAELAEAIGKLVASQA
jgi:PAS domain S-box-containing protein